RVGPDGADKVWIEISANPGEPLRSLHRVASGGELSRIMLAVQNALGHHDRALTSIFDEIDAGIGGRTATAVAGKLAGLAQHRQVLCVTHLPQIASVADHHLAVEKETRDGRTFARVSILDRDAREREIARMLAGA